MLSINHFVKKYPGADHAVLSIDTLQLPQGIYWMKGENGAGKTSLIKSIAGLLNFEGHISVNDVSLKKQRMNYTRLVNYAEAEPLYPPFLNGQELLDFYGSTNGGQVPNELIDNLHMGHFLNQKTGTYSSGMMKKLSLALAFTGKPALVLLDEPLIALDVASVTVLQQYITQQLANGVSFIVTSHQALDSHLVTYNGIFLIANQTLAQQ